MCLPASSFLPPTDTRRAPPCSAPLCPRRKVEPSRNLHTKGAGGDRTCPTATATRPSSHPSRTAASSYSTPWRSSGPTSRAATGRAATSRRWLPRAMGGPSACAFPASNGRGTAGLFGARRHITLSVTRCGRTPAAIVPAERCPPRSQRRYRFCIHDVNGGPSSSINISPVGRGRHAGANRTAARSGPDSGAGSNGG